ncbi:MAG TPA: hypothetical protein VFQ51_20990 [Vicinamibacteria bacterium]|nr:hypothetical protein [Vicinamibacteria bacterium]
MANETLTVRRESPHFQVHAGLAPASVVDAVADRLEAERARILSDLGVADVPQVRVRIWQDQAAWNAELTRYFGRSFTTAGYITGPGEMRLLALDGVAVNATHEFAHIVTLSVNPGFANNPRWLWEATALYANRELVDPRTLAYMTSGRPPTLQTLNSDVSANTQVYEVGYTLAEFVVATYGRDALLRLIRANGDLAAVLGLTAADFERDWYAFVEARYLS